MKISLTPDEGRRFRAALSALLSAHRNMCVERVSRSGNDVTVWTVTGARDHGDCGRRDVYYFGRRTFEVVRVIHGVAMDCPYWADGRKSRTYSMDAWSVIDAARRA